MNKNKFRILKSNKFCNNKILSRDQTTNTKHLKNCYVNNYCYMMLFVNLRYLRVCCLRKGTYTGCFKKMYTHFKLL